MAIMTGLSGNEMYCLHLKGLTPGELVVGNSVFSMGFVGSIGAGLNTLAGGEVHAVTRVIHDGREQSYKRLEQEARRRGGIGITGVTSELIQDSGNVEFLSIGSGLHREGAVSEDFEFSSSANGQELYCQMDCGFHPIKFVFGNVAYSIGIGGGIMGSLRSLGRGEVREFSQIFNETRHRALERIVSEAREVEANAVVGIQTTIVPFGVMQEMVMIGTASHHPGLPLSFTRSPVTSDLTNEEMWNVIHMGYMPIQLVLGVSVYSVGFVGGFMAGLKSFVRGEISELTTLIYEARENAIERIRSEAELVGADDVIGIKNYVYNLGGGIIEFMAIGTAVKKMPGFQTLSPQLPPQAVIRDKETLINTAGVVRGTNLNEKMS